MDLNILNWARIINESMEDNLESDPIVDLINDHNSEKIEAQTSTTDENGNIDVVLYYLVTDMVDDGEGGKEHLNSGMNGAEKIIGTGIRKELEGLLKGEGYSITGFKLETGSETGEDRDTPPTVIVHMFLTKKMNESTINESSDSIDKAIQSFISQESEDGQKINDLKLIIMALVSNSPEEDDMLKDDLHSKLGEMYTQGGKDIINEILATL